MPTGKERTMGVLGWIILGLVAGAIAKAVHRGDEPGGVLGTFVIYDALSRRSDSDGRRRAAT
jgi:hypothetical protein